MEGAIPLWSQLVEYDHDKWMAVDFADAAAQARRERKPWRAQAYYRQASDWTAHVADEEFNFGHVDKWHYYRYHAIRFMLMSNHILQAKRMILETVKDPRYNRRFGILFEDLLEQIIYDK